MRSSERTVELRGEAACAAYKADAPCRRIDREVGVPSGRTRREPAPVDAEESPFLSATSVRAPPGPRRACRRRSRRRPARAARTPDAAVRGRHQARMTRSANDSHVRLRAQSDPASALRGRRHRAPRRAGSPRRALRGPAHDEHEPRAARGVGRGSSARCVGSSRAAHARGASRGSRCAPRCARERAARDRRPAPAAARRSRVTARRLPARYLRVGARRRARARSPRGEPSATSQPSRAARLGAAPMAHRGGEELPLRRAPRADPRGSPGVHDHRERRARSARTIRRSRSCSTRSSDSSRRRSPSKSTSTNASADQRHFGIVSVSMVEPSARKAVHFSSVADADMTAKPCTLSRVWMYGCVVLKP